MRISNSLDLSKNDQLSVVIIRNFTQEVYASTFRILTLKSLPSLQVFMLEDIPALRSLDLSLNPSLTDITFNNVNVTSLDMSQCQLYEFPMEILKFGSSLEKLDLSRNQLSSLPDIFSSTLYALKVLYLNGNQFYGHLPITKSLFNLEELNLMNNQLTSLNGIHKYRALLQLTLDNNNIQEIPIDIIKLQELRTLTIKFNQLETIPYRMVNLRKLVYIDIANNNITEYEKALIKSEFKLVVPALRFVSL
ncbi:unnamed protein product [Didymodactylos carnosus]|uniref:Chaoptin n=1 Tax=Didymodactylos carnosus TaxID=1234261 RepID=A0A813ZVY8_9BILA|nr:unnamed protein product [Didymodactylos carnosus]CAF3686781.1 unnamed protein product [Didymodactylos carnosus]